MSYAITGTGSTCTSKDLSRLTSHEAQTKGAEMLEGLTPPVKIGTCRIRTILESLEAKDQEMLKTALANPDWYHSALARELTKRGLTVSDQALRIHRIGRCTCARKS